MVYLICATTAALLAYILGQRRGFIKGRRDGFDEGHSAAFEIAFREFKTEDGTPVTLEFYEAHALSTVASKIYDDKPNWFVHISMKLFGEAGEFAEHLGKASRDDGWDLRDGPSAINPERRMALLKELGDILWYVVTCAAMLGSSLVEVMLLNIEKRNGRKVRGTLQGSGDNR